MLRWDILRGEVSGTIDELIRHSVTKMSHLHFVCNKEARKRLIQMGETADRIFETGSPDYDVMTSSSLPSLNDAFLRYDIPVSFQKEGYGILLYHPVTTDFNETISLAKNIVEAIISSGKNFIVIYPNNDLK